MNTANNSMRIIDLQSIYNDFDLYETISDRNYVSINLLIRFPVENKTLNVDDWDNIYKEVIKNDIHRRRTR